MLRDSGTLSAIIYSFIFPALHSTLMMLQNLYTILTYIEPQISSYRKIPHEGPTTLFTRQAGHRRPTFNHIFGQEKPL
ncbi:hypothetical protein BDV29DRAFT_185588 [Aspergillus leporis]|uniref:Uncharacterized protein n=1 Tax=Aspergillus leporis TaxID=41062 RepID=A0A5N5WKD5_9EURO|nr:hypothetical protein BDV29DRAFT_185588 [Aspergillus leporis]